MLRLSRNPQRELDFEIFDDLKSISVALYSDPLRSSVFLDDRDIFSGYGPG